MKIAPFWLDKKNKRVIKNMKWTQTLKQNNLQVVNYYVVEDV